MTSEQLQDAASDRNALLALVKRATVIMPRDYVAWDEWQDEALELMRGYERDEQELNKSLNLVAESVDTAPPAGWLNSPKQKGPE
jgi:hypothetical protein